MRCLTGYDTGIFHSLTDKDLPEEVTYDIVDLLGIINKIRSDADIAVLSFTAGNNVTIYAPGLYVLDRKECHTTEPLCLKDIDKVSGILLSLCYYVMDGRSESDLDSRLIFFLGRDKITDNTDNTVTVLSNFIKEPSYGLLITFLTCFKIL